MQIFDVIIFFKLLTILRVLDHFSERWQSTLFQIFLPLKPGVGQNIAMHATLTARDFFLAKFYPSGPFTCIFFQNLSRVFPVLAVANTGSCVGTHNKIGHSFPCSVLAE